MSTVPRSDLSAGPEEVSAELDAMQAVGVALSHLHDPRARARVLRWATERFEIQVEIHVETPPSPVVAKTARVATRPIDQSMTLEGVREMFEAPAAALRPANLHLQAIEPPHVSGDAAQPQDIHCEAADSEPLDSLMRGLATDFQRFAVEWQRA
jgi:hypothetical protein